MTQTFLPAGEQSLLVTGFGDDDAIRIETGLGQGRCEQVRPSDAPQNAARRPRCDAGREEDRRGAVHGACSAACDLVKAIARQPTAGKNSVK